MENLSEAIQKRKRGDPLSKAEQELLRRDAKERRGRAIPVYFDSSEEKAKFQKLAEKDGIPVFSKWALLKLREISKGNMASREVVEQAYKDRDQFKKWYETEKEKVNRLEREKDDLNRKLQALAEKLAALALRVKP